MAFLVVEFCKEPPAEDGSFPTEIIPSVWCVNEKQEECFWPPRAISSVAFLDLLLNRCQDVPFHIFASVTNRNCI